MASLFFKNNLVNEIYAENKRFALQIKQKLTCSNNPISPSHRTKNNYINNLKHENNIQQSSRIKKDIKILNVAQIKLDKKPSKKMNFQNEKKSRSQSSKRMFPERYNKSTTINNEVINIKKDNNANSGRLRFTIEYDKKFLHHNEKFIYDKTINSCRYLKSRNNSINIFDSLSSVDFHSSRTSKRKLSIYSYSKDSIGDVIKYNYAPPQLKSSHNNEKITNKKRRLNKNNIISIQKFKFK